MKNYDLCVIGSGVGLSVLNPGLNRDWKCALVEKDKIGGTCLTRGCIPSKILIYPADMIRHAQHAKNVGVDFKLKDIDWNLMAKNMWSQIDEGKQIERSLKQVPNLDLYQGVGEFTDDYQMKVTDLDGNKELGEFKADRFVLASGARSIIPPIDGIDNIDYVTSESFFGQRFPKKPWKSLIIIGGGIIAAEFAHLFASVGTEVTIIEMLPRLVSTEEPEVSELLRKQFEKHMTVLLKERAEKVEQNGKSKKVITKNTETGEDHEVEAKEILIATGRRSNADLLKVEETGVETDEKGWIKANKYLETTKQNIWSIGDANGDYQFRHKANYDAEICSNNIYGDPSQKQMVDYSSVPWAIFTNPQIGHVGLTQQEAIDKGHQIYVAKKHYSTTAKGFAMGYREGREDDGFVKLVIDKSYKILGAHVIGPHAAVLVQPFVYLMNAGYTCDISEQVPIQAIPKSERSCPESGSFMPIYRSMVIHPSLSEVAAWAIGNMRPVNIKQEHHHHHDE
ncbi:MAG: Mycothione reductase [Promethearchaeota archaeon]|nr:MAG: Mycothione reductase [Candidatus Lokiarchaeota archaeon]